MGWPTGKNDTRDHSRSNYKGVDKWVVRQQGRHFCHCGCGGVIQIRAYMHSPSYGIPKFLPHHYLRSREFIIAQTRRAQERRGEKSHNWKGGKTKKQEILRKSKLYIQWRRAVFERDEYTCQNCKARSGKSKKVYLHAHHHRIQFVQLWEEFVAGTRDKSSLFDLDLGITLCITCHRATHAASR